LSTLLKATQDIQQKVNMVAQPQSAEAPEVLIEEATDNNPSVALKSRVLPSVFNSTADIAGGVFSRLDANVAARKAAETAEKSSLAAKRAAVMSAELHGSNDVDPAQNGEKAYRQPHPLTVAMQTCRSSQRAAAVRCLQLNMGQCHNTWVGAYMSCFHVFAQAKSWLVRAGRLPKARVQPKKVPAVPLPPEVRHTAQLACAHSYSKFSQTCSEAHRRSGALCRRFATHSGVGITPTAQARCGANHRQAQTVCSRARDVGRAKCETAWTTAKAIVTEQRGKANALTVAPAPLKDRLRRAQMNTMARVEEASRRLQEARRSGMVKKGTEKTLLLDLLAEWSVVPVC